MDAKSLLFRMLLRRILARTALACVLAWFAFAWATGRIAPVAGLTRVYAVIVDKMGQRKAALPVSAVDRQEDAAVRAAAAVKNAGLQSDEGKSGAGVGAKSSFSAADVLCLAHAVYYEARNEPRDTQIGVAQVALNRVAAMPGKKSICRIVYLGLGRPMGCLFAQTCRHLGTIPDDEAKWRAAVDLAQDVTSGKVSLSLYEKATHFNASSLRPSWVSSVYKLHRAGRFSFYSSARPNAVEGDEVEASLASDQPDQLRSSAGSGEAALAARRRAVNLPRALSAAGTPRSEHPAPQARSARQDPPRSPFGDTFN